MKKSVILVIAVIYVLAIVVVGFIGIRMKIYNANVYVEKIECVSDNYRKCNENDDFYQKGYDGYISVIYEENLKVLIKCNIYPENASEKKLEYIYDKSSTTYTLTYNDDGTANVEFFKGGSATIIVKSTDNVGTSIKILINAVDLGGIV
jgi:hypothetical protein